MAEALLNYFNTDKPREESIDSEPLKDKEEITVINISLQQNNMITTETISNSTINIIGPSLNQSGPCACEDHTGSPKDLVEVAFFSKEFAKTLDNIEDAIEEDGKSSRFLRWAKLLTKDDEPLIPRVEGAKTVTDLFQRITDLHLWSWSDIGLLDDLLDGSPYKKASLILNNYKKMLRDNVETRLEIAKEAPVNTEGMWLKLKEERDHTKVTLKVLLKHKEHLIKHFGIPADVLTFSHAYKGCVTTCWYITSEAAAIAIKEKLLQNGGIEEKLREEEFQKSPRMEKAEKQEKQSTTPPPYDDLKSLADEFDNAGPFISSIAELAMVNLISQIVASIDDLLSQLTNSKIKKKGEIQYAVKAIKDAIQKAYQYIDSVDDLMWWLSQSKLLVSAFNGLNSNNPDLKPWQELLDKVHETSNKVGENYKELEEACSEASKICSDASDACIQESKNAAAKSTTTKVVGGTVVAGAMAAGIGGGVAASVVTGVFTFGIGTIVGLGITAAASTVAGLGIGATTAATHVIAKEFEKASKAFRQLCQKFDDLLDITHKLQEESAKVNNKIIHISRLVYSIECSKWKKHAITYTTVSDSLRIVQQVCTSSHRYTDKYRRSIKAQMDKLESLDV